MAEVLGVVASGISVASFAIQLADSIKKLKEFVGNVRDAPEDIKYTILELDTLSLLLTDIGDEPQQNLTSVASNASLQRCLDLCRKGTSALDAIVKDLETDMQTRRKRASLKAWFKKDILEKYEKRLESAKSTLALSYQIYAKNILIEVRQAVLLPLAADVTMKTTMQQDMNSILSASSCQNEHPQARNRYRLNIATWFIAKTWNITFRRSVAGWNLYFCSYAVIPDDSPIFTACKRGDLETVKILFDSGQASPFCKNEDGWTPLHYAAMIDQTKDDREKRFQLCKFLLEKGADTSVVDSNGWIPLHFHVLSTTDENIPGCVPLVQILLKDSLDFDMEFFNERYVNLTLHWPPSATRLLHEQAWSPYRDIPLLQRLDYALQSLNRLTAQGLSVFEANLGCKLSRAVLDTAFANDAALRFFATTMWVYGHSTRRAKARPTPETSLSRIPWSEILVGAINRGVDLHTCQFRNSRDSAVQLYGCGIATAMTNFVQGWMEGYSKSYEVYHSEAQVQHNVGRAMETWVSELHDIDVDIDAFANSESKALEEHAARDSTSSYLALRCHGQSHSSLSWVVKLHGMRKSLTGPWELCFEWPPRRLYQLLGRQRPSSIVPGAWGSWELADKSRQSDHGPDAWEEAARRYRQRRRGTYREARVKSDDDSNASHTVETDGDSDSKTDEESNNAPGKTTR